MSECANKGCVDAVDVLVAFEDPAEVEGYCERCGIHEYKRNRTAYAIVDETSDLGELLESSDPSDDDGLDWGDVTSKTVDASYDDATGHIEYQDVEPATVTIDVPDDVSLTLDGTGGSSEGSDDEDATQAGGNGVPPVRDPDTGERLWHYEWSGWWWCENEREAFDWETGDVECPHCGETFHVKPPREDTEP